MTSPRTEATGCRLLPALLVMLDALAGLAYVASWRLLFADAGYFDQFELPSPFQHLWSLSIEEQFYFVWPLILGAVLPAARRRLARGSA